MKNKFIKILLVVLVAGVAFNLSLLRMNRAVNHQNTFSCLPMSEPATPSSILFSEVRNSTSSPLAYLFQLMFILFFISPPIIAFLLFLIWKELKERNKMK